MLFQDINFKFGKFRVSGRYAIFDAEGSNNRQYVYEKDVLYAFSSQMHYGEGWRCMVMMKYEVSGFLTFWIKVSQYIYPGENEIGSGLNMINSNHKTEVKIQAITRF
jgi:hypothetical protein